MNLYLNSELAEPYKNASQKVRVMTESWMAENMFCPCCGNDKLSQYENNRPVADFHCDRCGEIFELKSKQGVIGTKIADGSYAAAIHRITSKDNPHLFVMQYRDLHLTNLDFIPKYFFTPDVLEKRKPLATTARKAGWVGCNILYKNIPKQGKIPIIEHEIMMPPDQVVKRYKHTTALKTNDMEQRGWLMDVLQCMNEIPQNQFTLHQIYAFADTLAQKHPCNHNIKAKIRQQLQVLRENGYLLFLGDGRYKKIEYRVLE